MLSENIIQGLTLTGLALAVLGSSKNMKFPNWIRYICSIDSVGLLVIGVLIILKII